MDWDRNQVLLGNFNTGLTDTEYMQYNRSLYGAKVAYKSDGETRFGDPKRSLTAFASEPSRRPRMSPSGRPAVPCTT